MCRRSLLLLLAAALAVQGLVGAVPHQHADEHVVLALAGHAHGSEPAACLVPTLALHAPPPCLACAVAAPVAAAPVRVDLGRAAEPGARVVDRPAARPPAVATQRAVTRGPPFPG